MKELLSPTWFIESPVDFEHKQYLLFAYLQKVESSFLNKKLSPHLLHLERLSDELISFDSSFKLIKKDFEKNRYTYFDNIKLEGENNQIILEIKEIVGFSILQLEPRIKMGYKILEKNNQILY
jgi:hypothetical protein